MNWYHGTNTPIEDYFDKMRFDRDRGKADPNAEGPGWYWTSSFSDASSYGSIVYEGLYEEELGLMSSEAPTDLGDLLLLATDATREQRLTFVQNWGNERLFRGLVDSIVESHYTDGTMLENMVGLYHDLFQYDSSRYVEGARLVADGALVVRPEVKHLILWNIETMSFRRT